MNKLLDLVFDLFEQGCMSETKTTSDGRSTYNHDHISAYEQAQEVLLRAGRITEDQCNYSSETVIQKYYKKKYLTFTEEQVRAAFTKKRHDLPKCLNSDCGRDLTLIQVWIEEEEVHFHKNNYVTEHKSAEPLPVGSLYCKHCRARYPTSTKRVWKELRS